MHILRLLKEEEKFDQNNFHEQDHEIPSALSESLEYFIQEHILETLVSYALADEPQGFFKFMVGVIEDLLQSLTKTNLMS